MNEAHSFGSTSLTCTQLLRKPVDGSIKSFAAPSPKRLRIGDRLWFRKGSSAFGAPE